MSSGLLAVALASLGLAFGVAGLVLATIAWFVWGRRR